MNDKMLEAYVEKQVNKYTKIMASTVKILKATIENLIKREKYLIDNLLRREDLLCYTLQQVVTDQKTKNDLYEYYELFKSKLYGEEYDRLLFVERRKMVDTLYKTFLVQFYNAKETINVSL